MSQHGNPDFSDTLLPGSTLDGISPPPVSSQPTIPGYEVIREIDRGGMGVVYEARSLRLKKRCAIKTFVAGVHASEDSRQRFLAEAETLAGLDHPHLVKVFDLIEESYLVMEFLDG